MTPAKELHPTRRAVAPVLDEETGEVVRYEYVVEVSPRLIRIRPLGTRRGGPREKSVTPGQLHLRLTEHDIELERQRRKRKLARR